MESGCIESFLAGGTARIIRNNNGNNKRGHVGKKTSCCGNKLPSSHSEDRDQDNEQNGVERIHSMTTRSSSKRTVNSRDNSHSNDSDNEEKKHEEDKEITQTTTKKSNRSRRKKKRGEQQQQQQHEQHQKQRQKRQ